MADTVTMLGVAGNGTGGTTIPCMVTKAVFDAGSPSDFYGTNGEPFHTGTGAVIFDNDDEFTVDIASTSNLIVGMYCWLDSDASSNDPGWYEITSITVDDHITCWSLSLDGVNSVTENSTQSTHSIGGLGEIDDPDTADKFQGLLDLLGTYAATTTSGNNVDILWNQSFTTDTTIDIDNITGSSAEGTRVKVRGTDADFIVDGTRITITTETELTSGLFLMSTLSSSVTFENIDFDGGNGVDDALYCINATGTTLGTKNSYINCRFHNATSDGLHMRSSEVSIVDCEIDNNGGYGYNTISSLSSVDVSRNRIHDNDLGGVSWRPTGASNFSYNIVEGNGGNGILETNLTNGVFYIGNTVEGNTSSGFSIHAATVHIRLYNNTSSNNTSYGYNFNGNASGTFVYAVNSNNHAYGNSQPSDIATTDAAWLALASGNIVGDPLFTNAPTDFRPLSTSPLLDAGVGGDGDDIGALSAIAGGGGGVNLLTGLLT